MDDRPFQALRTHALVPYALVSTKKDVDSTSSPATRSVRGIASITTAMTATVPPAATSTVVARDVSTFGRHLVERMLRQRSRQPKPTHLYQTTPEERIVHGQRSLYVAVFRKFDISIPGQGRKARVSVSFNKGQR